MPCENAYGLSRSGLNFLSLPIRVFSKPPLTFWLKDHSTYKEISSHTSPPWRLIFIYTIWTLWISRNQLIFHNKEWSIHQTIFQIYNQTNEFLSPLFKQHPTYLFRKPIPVGTGGLMRDANGKWIMDLGF